MIYHQQEKLKTDEQQSIRQSDINDSLNLPLIRHYSSLFRKSSSDSSLPSPIDPFVLSMIEQQAAYASLFASISQGKTNLPMNFDSRLFPNNNSSIFIQRSQSQQKQQQNKNLKTKFDQISSKNHVETKRIKRDKTISTT
jgi:hypothetical protein